MVALVAFFLLYVALVLFSDAAGFMLLYSALVGLLGCCI
jgi:hypothetical protein